MAIPFAGAVALLLPVLAGGGLVWFAGNPLDALYVALTAAMWLIATAFVDVEQPRGAPDLANRLVPLGLVLSVPVAVYDRLQLLGALLPLWIAYLGIILGGLASLLGILARRALGRAYAPRPGHMQETGLVASGPYRWIRHPMYAAALIWMIGWPLIARSLLGSLVALVLTVSALRRRIDAEETELLRVHGEAYQDYRRRTWRLIPHVY